MGELVLRSRGITIPSFRIAGGILLLLSASVGDIHAPYRWATGSGTRSGSSLALRTATAAGLYRRGWAPLVVLSNDFTPDRVREIIALGARRFDYQGESRLVLEKYGVPADAIVALSVPVKNTEAELRLVAEAARARGWRRVILVTSPQPETAGDGIGPPSPAVLTFAMPRLIERQLSHGRRGAARGTTCPLDR